MLRTAAGRCLRQAISATGKTLAQQQMPAAQLLLLQQRGFVRSALQAAAAGTPGPHHKALPAHVHLAELLDREAKEELEAGGEEEKSEDLEEISEKIHKRFTVKESEGSSVVKMHAKHGNEKIAITFDVQETTEDELEPEDLEGEDAENYTVGIRAMATVTKGHSKLIFSLVCTNGIWIEKVAFDSQNRDVEDLTLYWSDFAEYPEDVQEAFRAYLDERDINDELATFVSYHAYHKEKDQYVEFLESAKAFIAN